MKNKDEYTEFIWIVKYESGSSKIYFHKLISILYKRVIEDSYESKGSDRREELAPRKRRNRVTGKRRGERVTEKRMKR